MSCNSTFRAALNDITLNSPYSVGVYSTTAYIYNQSIFKYHYQDNGVSKGIAVDCWSYQIYMTNIQGTKLGGWLSKQGPKGPKLYVILSFYYSFLNIFIVYFLFSFAKISILLDNKLVWLFMSYDSYWYHYIVGRIDTFVCGMIQSFIMQQLIKE